MKRETLARTIIETMLKKSLRDIECDPDRSIRNLIDLGINFARGRFQREFLHALQEMMQNEQSAYYTLVKQVVAYTDRQRLTTLGMNTAFQACTLGADIIRKNEARLHFNIPWIYQVDFGTDGLPCNILNKLINQGEKLGTFVYLLNGCGSVTGEQIAVLTEHKDCTFILTVSAREVLGDLMENLLDTVNCLILVEEDASLMEEAADELRKHGFLYGICRKCAEADTLRVLEPDHLEQIASTGAALYLLMPETFGVFAADDHRREETARIRSQQEYPFILIDYVSDVQRIDQVVSGDSCAVAFDAMGRVYTDTGIWQETPYNIRQMDLKDILAQVTRKSDAPL